MTSGEDNWSVSLWDELACSAPYSICALMGGASDPNDISAYYDDECVPGRFHHGELRKKSNWNTSAMVLSRNRSGQLRSIYQLPRAASDAVHFCWAADILPWSGYCIAVVEPHNDAERYEKALRAISERGVAIYADEEVRYVSEVEFKRMPLKTGVSKEGDPRWIWTEDKAPKFLEENQDIYLLAKFVDAFSPVFARNTTHLETVAMDKAQVILEILTNGLLEPFDTSIPFNWNDAPAKYAAYEATHITVPALSFETAFSERAADYANCKKLSKLWIDFLEKYSITLQPYLILDRSFNGLRKLRDELGLDSAIDACWNGVGLEYLL